MKNNLILSGFPYEFEKNSKNILSGSWVLENSLLETNIKNFDVEVAKYHWSSNEKLQSDYHYLKNLYFVIRKALSDFLNSYHGVKNSERYWDIVAGPWLIPILSMIFDRWETLRYITSNYSIKNVNIFDQDLETIITSDFADMMKKANIRHLAHYWNHFIFAEILKFNYNSEININSKKKNFLHYNQKINSNIPERNILLKIVDKKLCNFFSNSKILYYDTCMKKKEKILFSLVGKSPILYYSEFEKKINLNFKINRRSLKLNFNSKNKFENFLSTFILKLIPVSHLEGYKHLLTLSSNLQYDPKIIFTSYGHYSNDFFKIWLAEQTLKKKKLIISSHGGSIEKEWYFNSWIDISDLYVTWTKEDSKKTIQLPPLNLLKPKKILKKDKGKKLLFLSTNHPLFAYRIQDLPPSSEMLNYFNFYKKLFKKLDDSILEKLLLRLHPLNDVWNLRKKFAYEFGDDKISKTIKLEDDFKNSKLIISSSTETTFFESMKTGIPTLVILYKDLWNLNNYFLSFYDELKKNKIIFTDINSAISHINQIWNNPLEWWNSEKIINIREKFTTNCSLEDNKEKLNWNHFVKKIENYL